MLLSFIIVVSCLTPCSTWSVDECASRIPDDVDVYLRVSRGSDLRESLDETPLGGALGRAFRQSELTAAWHRLAGASRLKERDLFDRFIGSELTIVIRYEPSGIDGVDRTAHWAAMTTISGKDWRLLDHKLGFRAFAPRDGVSMSSLPEHRLVFARRNDRVLIGPDDERVDNLFDELLERWRDPSRRNLTRTARYIAAERLGKGAVTLILRHDPTEGGYSAFVANLDGDRVTVEQVSRFVSSPFGEPARPTTIDRELIRRLSEEQFMVIAHPFSWPTHPLTTFLEARFDGHAIPPAGTIGERMMIIFGSVEEHQRVGITLAVEVRLEGQSAIDRLDRFATASVNLLRSFDEEQPAQEIGDRWDGPRAIRSVPVGDDASKLFAGMPGIRDVALSWSVAKATDGKNWWLFSSEPAHCLSIRTIIESGAPGEHREMFGQVGTLSGPCIGRQLHRFAQLTMNEADASNLKKLTLTLADILRATQRVTWTTEVPGQNRVRSNWQLELD